MVSFLHLQTVTTSEPLDNLEVDTPFRIENITAAGYDGQYVVFDKTSDTEITVQGNTALQIHYQMLQVQH